MTYYVGVDPDLHSTAIAVADLEDVLHVEVVRVPSSLKGHDAVQAMAEAAYEFDFPASIYEEIEDMVPIIESQRIYKRHDKASPNSLILLAQVAGIWLRNFAPAWGVGRLALPQDWKGQLPKEIDQARTYTYYGWDWVKTKGYVIPTNHGFTNVKDSDWKHLGDAVGIALWAAKEDDEKRKREERKARA